MEGVGGGREGGKEKVKHARMGKRKGRRGEGRKKEGEGREEDQ